MLIIKEIKSVRHFPILEVPIDDIVDEFIYVDIISQSVVEFSLMDPPLSFDILLGFMSDLDDVLTFPSMIKYIFSISLSLIMMMLPHPKHMNLILMMSL